MSEWAMMSENSTTNEELRAKVQQLEAHVHQLKNIIAKSKVSLSYPDVVIGYLDKFLLFRCRPNVLNAYLGANVQIAHTAHWHK